MPSKRTRKTQKRRELPAEGFARLDQVLEAVPMSESAWYRGIAAGKFPRPVKLGPRTSAWPVSAIRELIASMDDDAA